ncbi:MAG: D-alanyl-D-alanine carboxypeptidase family protein [Actinomycetes bacterium]
MPDAHEAPHTAREAALDRSANRASRERGGSGLVLPPIPDDLDGLKQASAQARDRLKAATATWKAAHRVLVLTRARQRNLSERARELRGVAGRSRVRLGEIAAESYRRPNTGLAVMLDRDKVQGFLRDAALLRHVERVQGEEVGRLLATQHQARSLAGQAAGLARQIRVDARALDARRDRLAAYADKVQRRLDTALARLEAKRRAANPVAGVAGCEPRPGYKHYPNGLIPSDALCPLPQDGHYLRADAAAAFHRLNDAYKDALGRSMCVTDSYRSLESQRTLYAQKPGLAAVPGTSNHGYGLAVDLCGGAESYGSTEHEWLDAHGDRFGWDIPSWARSGGSREEPWHWEFVDG